MSYLPPLGADQSLSRLTTPDYTQPSPLTFRPVATKVEKYAKLMKIDQHQLQRPRAHFRNALKTTEGLERVTRELKQVNIYSSSSVKILWWLARLWMVTSSDFCMFSFKRLAGLQNSGAGISFERLSAFRDAFNDIIKMNQTYGPQLNQIKVNIDSE